LGSCCRADNGKDAITLIVDNKPDVAIIDYSLPLINGIEVTRSIKQRQIKTEILIFTMHDSDVLVKEAFKAGARAFLLFKTIETHRASAMQKLSVNSTAGLVRYAFRSILTLGRARMGLSSMRHRLWRR
jgi:DNA-binding NarL/FixJ family response regulator